MESRPVSRGVARLVPVPREAVRTYDLCRACGAKHETEDGRRV
ncbi:hypothetical protein ACI797_16410 [Geodermatophilus sp. SYSU D00691]